jgi:hypothetical protein
MDAGTSRRAVIHKPNGFDVVEGVAVDLGGITSFEAFFGYV